MAGQAAGLQLTWSHGSPRSSHWHLALAMDTLMSAPALAASKSMNPSIAAAACARRGDHQFALAVLCSVWELQRKGQKSRVAGGKMPRARLPAKPVDRPLAPYASLCGAGRGQDIVGHRWEPGIPVANCEGQLFESASANELEYRGLPRTSPQFAWPCKRAVPAGPPSSQSPLATERLNFGGGREALRGQRLPEKRLREPRQATGNNTGGRARARCAGRGETSSSASPCLCLSPCRKGT